MKRNVAIHPETRAGANGVHPRSPAAERSLALARAYMDARRALWAAAGPSFRDRLRLIAPGSEFTCGDDSPAAFESAARSGDRGFRISREIPGLGREIAAATGARNKLVEANLGLAHAYVGRRCRGGDSTGLRMRVDPDDMTQAACEALILAADLFDPERGTSFTTYACWWVRVACQKAEFAGPPVRLPGQALDAWRKAEAVRGRVAAETGTTPTLEEVLELLGRSPSHAAVVVGVERALRAVPEEIDDFADHEDGSGRVVTGLAALADPGPSPEEAVAHGELLAAVRAVVDEAPAAERVALEGLATGATLGDLAREAGVSLTSAPVVRRRAVDAARLALARVK